MDGTVFTAEEKDAAKKLGISARLLRLLRGRGLSNGDIPGFLQPSLSALSSPYDIFGMREAAERVRRAVENREKILIFGDYDCDGICAISILMLALRAKGADADYFIPNRLTDGYGMNVGALERIVAHRRPDLVITVDCGITAVEEAEYLRAQGIDLVVTDHHEPQEKLPDCIVADAKIDRGRGFSDLCGAGVALALVRALFGDEYKKYLDICAVATIADVVPLVGDNRIIAYYGLKMCAESPRRGIKMLAGSEKLTSQDVMFRLAPRINAAGRLGSAMKAVGLFLDEDYFMLKTLAEELERDNARRQEICEQVVADAKRALRCIDFDRTRIIVLHDASWEAGVLGIAAARLVEEFKCPAVLFSGDGEEYKGSARSVKSVNIFELLSRHSGLYTTFGGHAQAAGVGMLAANFARFKEEVERDVVEHYPAEDFLPADVCDMQLAPDEDFLSLAKELELLEPTGYGNPKPVFEMEESGMKFERIGFGPHVKYAGGGLELVGFSRFSQLAGTTRGRTAVEFSLGVGCFRNRVYAQGILRSVSALTVEIDDAQARLMCLHQLRRTGAGNVGRAGIADARKWARGKFGTAFVVFTQAEYERLLADVPECAGLPVFVGAQKWLNPATCVVFAPSAQFEFAYFGRVVIAGRPLSAGYAPYISERTAECLSLYGEEAAPPCVTDQKIRAAFVAFDLMARRKEHARTPHDLAAAVRAQAKLTAEEYEISRLILEDLGLISVSDRGIITVSRQKTDLGQSAYYQNVRHQQ